MKKNKKALHGNNAKVDPAKSVPPLNATNMVTLSDSHRDGTPIVRDDFVEYAKKFVEENKK